MRKKPKYYSDTEKVKILKRHLLEKIAISELCEENDLSPSVYYTWQTKLFENAEEALSSKKTGKRTLSKEQEKIRLLEERIKQREEALAELMTEHVALKKSSIGLA